MDSIISFLAPFAALLAGKFPVLAVIGANGLAVCLFVGVLIEAVELVAVAMNLGNVGEAAKKVDDIKNSIIAVLEIIPHANIPVAAILVNLNKYGSKVVLAVKGALAGWNSQ